MAIHLNVTKWLVAALFGGLVNLVSAPTVAHAQRLGCAANGVTPAFGVTESMDPLNGYGTALATDETWEVIVGDPLIVASGSRGAIAVWVCQPAPLGVTRQYFSEDDWGNVVWLNGTATASRYTARYHGSTGRFTAVSQVKSTVGAVHTIRTVLNLGSAAQLTRILTYTDGSYTFRTRWELTNTSTTTYNDLRLFNGGDTFFGGDDSARSWWNPELNLVYVNNSQFLTSGTMGFRGAPATPADRFCAGSFSTCNTQARTTAQLGNTTDSNYVDAGYHLQWNRASLAPGETWTIEAQETWTDPTYVQVLAPSDQLVSPNSVATLTFGVHNLDAAAHSFNLTTSSSLGWLASVVGSTTINVPALSVAAVSVQVTVPPGVAVNTVAGVTLTATDPVAPSTGSSSTNLTVFQPNYTITPTSLDFGSVSVGQSSTLDVTLSNTGSTVQTGSVGVPSALAPPYSIVADGCSNRTVANGGSCVVSVRFAPTASGAANDGFNIPILAPIVTSQLIGVTGSGAALPSCTDGSLNSNETDVDCGGDTCDACPDGDDCLLATDCDSGVCSSNVCAVPTCSDTVLNGSETDVDCGGATCAACADGDACATATDCDSGVCSGNICAVPTCSDTVLNGSETDVDCGGTCDACADGDACVAAADCNSGVCSGSVCAAPTCTDAVLNGNESDTDCGGGTCSACADGDACAAAADCTSGVCSSNVCAAPTCSDSVLNGNETDLDCGGPACSACADGGACTVAGDCSSNVCAADMCVPPTCMDGTRNGAESDVDCGGDACAPCADGDACGVALDCTSAVCAAGECAVASCTDNTRNGNETDVDCGGDACDPCADGAACTETSDCNSRVCASDMCVPATCADTVLNGSESDVDCGGGTCAACTEGDTCAAPTDCNNGVCANGMCAAAACDDRVRNGQESDVDCGGACAPCDNGSACGLPGDCASNVCEVSMCVDATCADGVLNGEESDVDCGGDCTPCATDLDCDADADCASNVCRAGACAAATCEDEVRNGEESDVDCGGRCGACDAEQACNVASDCASGVCTELVCRVASCVDGVQNQGESGIDVGGPCLGGVRGGGFGCSVSMSGETGTRALPLLLVGMLGLVARRRRR